jgi:Bacterial Ig-like domain (group 3)
VMGLAGMRRTALAMALSAGALAALVIPEAALGDTTQFLFSGGPVSFTVPDGVHAMSVTAIGGAGGAPGAPGVGQAGGGKVTNVLAVTPGDTYTIIVGGSGGEASFSPAGNFPAAGFNGGGGGAMSGDWGGGGGTDVCGPNASSCSNTNALIVAGGGGGAGGLTQAGGAGGQSGGDGGPQSSDPAVAQGGFGATPAAAGAGGHGGTGADPAAGGDGAAGVGGRAAGTQCNTGAGGGGRFGGGGGGSSSNGCGSGGGGSSVGPAGSTFTSGVFGTIPTEGGEVDITVGDPTTTASTPGSNGAIMLGATIRDTASVVGDGANGSPSGTVTYSVCGPGLSSCTSGGTAFDSETLTAGASDTSTATSVPFTPTTAGTYCFRADYGGDDSYLLSSDGSSDECFTVAPLTPTVTSTPATTLLQLGGSVTDRAQIAGSAAGGTPGGTVSFSVCANAVDSCSSGATPVGSSPVAVSGSGNNATGTSASFTPRAVGQYCFGAVYSGSTNYSAASDIGADECFTVTAANSSTTSSPSSASITLGQSLTDIAQVTGVSGLANPTGIVGFMVCGPPASSCNSGGTVAGGGSLSPNGNGVETATSPSFTPHATGAYCFRAVYSGDSRYLGSSDRSSGECFTVGVAQSTTASTPSSAAVTLGRSETDTATVTGNAAGGSPMGGIEFIVCDKGAGPCTAANDTDLGLAPVSAGPGNTATATSPSFTAPHPGTFCFLADYLGDPNYVASSDESPAECFTVGPAPSATQSTPAPASIAVGQSATDSVTLTGNATGGSPTGSVSFFVCGPGASDCSSGGTALGAGPMTVAGGAGNTATATSGSFTPSAAGTYCFRADYGGDTNYDPSSDGSTDECVTVGAANSTTAGTPAQTGFTLGASVTDAATVTGNAAGGSPTGHVGFVVCGPGATSCTSGGTAVGAGPVDVTADAGNTATATSGSFTPSAAGTYCFRADYGGDTNYNPSSNGTSAQCFTVAAPPPVVTPPAGGRAPAPTVTISSPARGAKLAAGSTKRAGYGCADAGGAGIASCVGSVSNGAKVDTSRPGRHTLTVTATSKDGTKATVTRTYTVVPPPNTFKITNVTTQHNGRLTFDVTVPGPGTIQILETNWNDNLEHTAVLLKPAPRRMVWARAHRVVNRGGTYAFSVDPNALGVRVAAHPRYKVSLRLWVSYRPSPHGIQRNIGLYGVPITR